MNCLFDFLKVFTRALLVLGLAVGAGAAPTDPVILNWLDGAPPPAAGGVSWGVPWPKGAIPKNQTFTLTTGDNKTLPLQTWPLAYWPDGSIKWMGYATLAGADSTGPLKLTVGGGTTPAATAVKVIQTSAGVDIDTGNLQCHISTTGANLFDSLTLNGREIATGAHLVLYEQHSPTVDVDSQPPLEKYTSNVKKVTVEQSGPVRAVVKIEGLHKADASSREWLPFVVRLYFYAGNQPIQMVHTILFDGDQEKDFIHGLGVVVNVPMREEIQNRHVRFAGESQGLWAEPILPLTGYNRNISYPGGGSVFDDQVSGATMPNRAQLPANSQYLLDTWASWDDFRLLQPNEQGFTVEKRTNAQSSWLPAGSGKRANGLVYAGDVSGGLAVGLKNFWQSYPTSLEVRHAKAATAEVRVWLWSPDAPVMDLRHYDTVAHGLNESYEDVQPGFSTPYGVGRTHELTLFPYSEMPYKADTEKAVQFTNQPPLLVATPQYLHDQRAFGIWSLQDRSTPFKKAVEDQLDAEISFYEKAVDQYSWYGFWDFGNVMHSYDASRHVWKYDIGGFAWDNDEQGTDMFLWYSFLRTGRADIFRLAEAMSRQTGEVEFYHFGPFAGLGSRHNVNPWGDGAKEARISMAPYRRFYYYLTTDERTGDVMHDTLQAEKSILTVDPMREADPPVPEDAQYPARIRAGPDWFAFLGDWMTEWERTGDTKWRDKIYAGMDSIAAMPYWFMTGQNLLWGFYPDTGKLVPRQLTKGGYNLVNNMGGPEVMFELNTIVDHPQWQKIWLQYCRLSGAPADVIKQDQTTGTEGANGQYAGGGRMAGYVYFMTKNAAFGQRALGGISVTGSGYSGQFQNLVHLDNPDVLKPMDEPSGFGGLVTNNVNQNSLNTIELLELCGDMLPTEVPAANARGAGRRGGRGFGGAPPAAAAPAGPAPAQ